jgi:hypothetical protein
MHNTINQTKELFDNAIVVGSKTEAPANPVEGSCDLEFDGSHLLKFNSKE